MGDTLSNSVIQRISPLLVCVGLTGLAVFFLWPGLYGGFYLDDFVNLGSLPEPDAGFVGQLGYLMDTPVGGSGRPLSYLSFLAQADSWPNSPFNFKLINLLIHLGNGLLVSCLSYLIALRVVEKNRLPQSSLLALSAVAGFFWVILPINMSSVFYVVQRMTLLSAFMMLIAVVGFSYLRTRYAVWGAKTYLLASLVIGFGYFGIFAKETAILTGLLILVVEYSVYSRTEHALNRVWKFVVLILPLALVIVYLFVAGKVFGGYGGREFSLSERLMSQSVIIFDYLSKILLPTNARINLYNDGYPFAAVVGSYTAVIAAVVALLAALVIGLHSRWRWPLVSLGVLFFLAGHFLESTFIPLELYFEHRNYLPSVGIVIAVVLGLGCGLTRLRQQNRPLGIAVLVTVSLWGGWLTLVGATEARTWGDPRAFAIAALTERPDSLRARQEMAAYFLAAGDHMGAANLLYSIDNDFGIYSGTYAQLLMLKCFREEIPVPGQAKLVEIFKEAPFDFGTLVALRDIWDLKRSSPGGCPAVSSSVLLEVVNALLENPSYKNRSNFFVLKSLILAEDGLWGLAARVLEEIPEQQVSIPELILTARFYNYAGQSGQALAVLRDAQSKLMGPLDHAVYGDHIEDLKNQFVANQAKEDKGEVR